MTVEYVQNAQNTQFVDAGRVSTSEWRMEDMEVANTQIYECHDNFAEFDEICIEKWKLNEDEIAVIVKDEHKGDLEFSLTDSGEWMQVFRVNGDGKRVCTQISGKKLCVDFTLDTDTDTETEQIQRIDRIFIKQMAKKEP